MKIITNHIFLERNNFIDIEEYNPYLLKSFYKYKGHNQELFIISDKQRKTENQVNYVYSLDIFKEIEKEYTNLFLNYRFNPKIFKFFLYEKYINDDDFYLLIDSRDCIFNNNTFNVYENVYKDTIIPSFEWNPHFHVREWILNQLLSLFPEKKEFIQNNSFNICTGMLGGQGNKLKSMLKDFCEYINKTLTDKKFPKTDTYPQLSSAGFGDQCLFNMFLMENIKKYDVFMDWNLSYMLNLNLIPERLIHVIDNDHYIVKQDNSSISYRPFLLHHTEYHSCTKRDGNTIKQIKF
jgi:hypothetical protein